MSIKIIPTKHFIDKLGKQFFDLSVISKINVEIAKNPEQKLFELTTGSATIVAIREEVNLVKLITGWKGNRKKEQIMEYKNGKD